MVKKGVVYIDIERVKKGVTVVEFPPVKGKYYSTLPVETEEGYYDFEITASDSQGAVNVTKWVAVVEAIPPPSQQIASEVEEEEEQEEGWFKDLDIKGRFKKLFGKLPGFKVVVDMLGGVNTILATLLGTTAIISMAKASRRRRKKRKKRR